MTQSAHTRCWGVLLAFGLQLPAVPPPAPPDGQSVPPPVDRPAPTAPWASAWTQPLTSSEPLFIALSRDFTLVAGPDTPLEARASATGDTAWSHHLDSWQALAATDTLALGVSGDHAYALDAATGRTRWVTQTTGPNTQLVVTDQHLLMVSDNDVLLRDVVSGTPHWRAGLTSPPAARAGFGTNVVAVAQQDGTIVLFDLVTGEERWRRTLARPALALTVDNSLVYAGLDDGTFCALGSRDGREQWCPRLRVPMVDEPLVDETVVRVALLDNSLRTFDRQNGSMHPSVSLGHRPAAGPWLSGDTIVLALTTGEFVVRDRASGRTLVRLPVSDAGTSHVLEAATISPDGRSLLSLTIAPGGARRLSVYRPTPTGVEAITDDLPEGAPVPLGAAPSTTGPVTPEVERPVPRPFPLPR